MSIRVITPPQPFVLPDDISGDYDEDMVTSLIAAVIETYDSYTGSLGRCLAPQLLEWSTWLSCTRTRLPLGPVLELGSVITEDRLGAETTEDPSTYRLGGEAIVLADGFGWVRQPVHRVRYWAGYGARSDEDPEVWVESVPERVKVAVRLSVQHLLSTGADNLFLSAEEVEGVGRQQFTVSEQASKLIAATCDRLLSGLQVPRL